ncbi:CDP-diacylglycerol--serine O-phosphatidyltransferase [bacterium]
MEFWKDNSLFILPSLFTVLNLLLGAISIFLAINEHFIFSAWMIIIAILCDGLDGKIARWANCETAFGVQLDSLADLISSGMAPIILIYQVVFKQIFWPYSWICLLFLFAGTYRLARFNIIQKGDRSQGYTGLPIPVAGMSIAAFCLFSDAFSVKIGWLTITLFMLFYSILMISTIPYSWPKLIWHQGRLKFGYSVFLLFCVTGMIIFTKYTLFPLLCFYIIIGLGKWIIETLREAWAIKLSK